MKCGRRGSFCSLFRFKLRKFTHFLTTFPFIFVLDSNYGAETLEGYLALSPEIVPVVELSLATESISFKALQS